MRGGRQEERESKKWREGGKEGEGEMEEEEEREGGGREGKGGGGGERERERQDGKSIHGTICVFQLCRTLCIVL